MSEAALPEAFEDLAPWLDWALEPERARTAKKVASSMEELRAFYDAVMPRMEEIIAYRHPAGVGATTRPACVSPPVPAGSMCCPGRGVEKNLKGRAGRRRRNTMRRVRAGPPAHRLYLLTLSLVEVANLVELYKRREVIEACDPLHFNPQH